MVLVLLACLATPQQAELLDIDGNPIPAVGKPGEAPTVVYFVTNDCPISNRLMPEVGRICEGVEAKQGRCLLAYVDASLSVKGVREHQRDYGIRLPTVLDADHSLVRLAGATVTPEAAVFDRRGELAYRGRINNLYAALGTPRRHPTENDLRDALDEVMAGKAVTKPRTQAIGCFIPRLSVNREDSDR